MIAFHLIKVCINSTFNSTGEVLKVFCFDINHEAFDKLCVKLTYENEIFCPSAAMGMGIAFSISFSTHHHLLLIVQSLKKLVSKFDSS